MPEKETIARARQDAGKGKSPSTQAGEFVREEIHHVREGKHGVRSTKQAIAIGLSKARKAGVKLPAYPKGSSRKSISHVRTKRAPSLQRSRATLRALKREPHRAVSHPALVRQARSAAHQRSARARSLSAHRAARTRARE